MPLPRRGHAKSAGRRRGRKRRGHGLTVRSYQPAEKKRSQRTGIVLRIIAGTLATTQPDAAAIIQRAAETYVAASVGKPRLISSTLTEALGEESARELRARSANMDWDQALAYTLAQVTQTLNDLQPETQP